MSSTESTSSVAIGNFPNELILEIGQYLDYPSAIFFAATNRLNRALIDPPQLSQKEKLEFAIRAEGFNQHSLSSESGPGYACPECFCVRKEEHFDRKHCVKSPERITPNHLLVRNCTECRDTYRTLYHGDAVLFIEKDGLPRPQWKCTLCEQYLGDLACWGCPSCRLCVRGATGLELSVVAQAPCPRCNNLLVHGKRWEDKHLEFYEAQLNR
ncbi:hypothetical protein IWZ01DRAFT_498273 [Phyllosticta capitalensis]